MRKMMLQQAELARQRGETFEENSSNSDWSEPDDESGLQEESKLGMKEGNRLAPPSNSQSNNDLESGALSDVNSMCCEDGDNLDEELEDERGHDGDMDDTSMSSRASSRMLDSINGM